MGKVKIKRKSTLIDMTAMSDVTVLLLTFFMLTSTFLTKEPVTVVTPSSVQEEKVPMSNLATVLVSPQGQVFLEIIGEADPDAVYNSREAIGMSDAEARSHKGMWGTDSIKLEILDNAIRAYNQKYENNPAKQIKLTGEQRSKFMKLSAIGVPIKDLPRYLDMSTTEQDMLFSDFFKLTPEEQAAWNKSTNIHIGIPIDDNRDVNIPAKRNDFQIWMQAIAQTSNPNLVSGMKKGEALAIKADQGTPYEIMHPVLDNLQSLKLTRMKFMTALKER